MTEDLDLAETSARGWVRKAEIELGGGSLDALHRPAAAPGCIQGPVPDPVGGCRAGPGCTDSGVAASPSASRTSAFDRAKPCAERWRPRAPPWDSASHSPTSHFGHVPGPSAGEEHGRMRKEAASPPEVGTGGEPFHPGRFSRGVLDGSTPRRPFQGYVDVAKACPWIKSRFSDPLDRP